MLAYTRRMEDVMCLLLETKLISAITEYAQRVNTFDFTQEDFERDYNVRWLNVDWYKCYELAKDYSVNFLSKETIMH